MKNIVEDTQLPLTFLTLCDITSYRKTRVKPIAFFAHSQIHWKILFNSPNNFMLVISLWNNSKNVKLSSESELLHSPSWALTQVENLHWEERQVCFFSSLSPWMTTLLSLAYWPKFLIPLAKFWGTRRQEGNRKRPCEGVLISTFRYGEFLILSLLWNAPWVFWRPHPYSSPRTFYLLSLTWVIHSPPGLLRIYPWSTISWHSSSTQTLCYYPSQGPLGQNPFE